MNITDLLDDHVEEIEEAGDKEDATRASEKVSDGAEGVADVDKKTDVDVAAALNSGIMLESKWAIWT